MTKRKVVQPDLIDLLLADYQKPEDLLGEHGIIVDPNFQTANQDGSLP